MKYIVLVGDGMADYPLEELQGKTPLEAAKTPNMDYIAECGQVGWARTIPDKMAPASDVATLSILGYDPAKFYSGRGPLEAANMGIKLKKDDLAFRCNLVTTGGDKMLDYSAGHINNKEAHILIKDLDKHLGTDALRFYPGVSYRHLMVTKDLKPSLLKVRCTPPHDIVGQSISGNLPRGRNADSLIDLMRRAGSFLEHHEVNKVRVDLGESPANSIWLWGQGKHPAMPKFEEKYGVRGSVISAVDLIKGIGRIIGLEPIDVPGATGYYDTDYRAKAAYGIESLKKKDFIFIHVEAPDEAGHNGDLRAKITAIERFDSRVVGQILEHFRKRTDVRILVLPDHYTPIPVRTHTSEPIFFALWGQGVAKDEICAFNESAARQSKLNFPRGWQLMDYFIKHDLPSGARLP
ncbi:MAG: cofactor-independent phosphoglycerate mutase [Candidatus Omnitrophica bacterium]|nr:cofactor-independent phosphoglycerate mutase [Candidatus Omnitrophota bacterium]